MRQAISIFSLDRFGKNLI